MSDLDQSEFPSYHDTKFINGEWITDVKYQKVSNYFKADQFLDDSECSEDYDNDCFFEGSYHCEIRSKHIPEIEMQDAATNQSTT